MNMSKSIHYSLLLSSTSGNCSNDCICITISIYFYSLFFYSFIHSKKFIQNNNPLILSTGTDHCQPKMGRVIPISFPVPFHNDIDLITLDVFYNLKVIFFIVLVKEPSCKFIKLTHLISFLAILLLAKVTFSAPYANVSVS